MAIDVFLPTVVRQAITIDKSGSNVSGTLIPQKDPSGEENRGVKGQPSPTELFVGLSGHQNAGVQAPSATKPTPPELATPPFADYLAQEKAQQNNQAGNQQTYQALSPLTMQEMPPVIAEFLNDIAKQHGVEAPSQQQLQSALRMTSDYRPPKPVIIDTKPVVKAVNSPDTPEADTSEIGITQILPATPIVSPQLPKQPAPKQSEAQQSEAQQSELQQNASETSSAYSTRFDALSQDIQKSALDYGRMLEALNRYSVTIETQN